MTRQYTEQLLEMIEDGMLDRDAVIMACVKYLSEDEVRDMMEVNEFVPEEEDDGQPTWEQEWEDFGECYE